MNPAQVMSMLRVANPILGYAAGLTFILLFIRQANRAEGLPEGQNWKQAAHATLHCSIWFALLELLAIV